MELDIITPDILGRGEDEKLNLSIIDKIEEWNQTAQNFGEYTSMPSLFEKQVKKRQEYTAVEDEDSEITYAELDQKANRLALWLKEKGLKNETVVGVCSESCVELVVAILAIMKAGGVYLPLDPHYPKERLKYILDDSKPAMLLTQKSLASSFQGMGAALHCCLDKEAAIWKRSTYEEPLELNIDPENLAYIIYTSGSSGKPKGTMLTHRGLVNLACAQGKAFSIKCEQRVLQFASINFDASVSEIFMTLAAGATLCMASKVSMEAGGRLQGTLQQRKINVVTLAPVVLPLLSSKSLPQLDTLVVAGEACSQDIASLWGRHRQLINAYGPTEVTVCASTQLCDPAEEIAPPIGKPIANTRLYILDNYYNPVPLGSSGELCIAGAGLARGYLNRADLTAEKFIPDPFSQKGGERMYNTGDLARYLEDGRIEFLGRIDDQVKIRGFRIELGDIESQLRRLEGVNDALVVALSDSEMTESYEKILVAYLTVEEGTGGKIASWPEIKKTLEPILPDYMIPNEWVLLERFPITPNGKVDRKALPKPIRQETIFVYSAPTDEIEETLCRIWSEVLKRDRVGVHDNFFDLGGHSLAVARVMIKISSAFQIDLQFSYLYEAPTVSRLAKIIHSNKILVSESEDRGNSQWVEPSKNLCKLNAVATKNSSIFIVPGAGGAVDMFRSIAIDLGTSGSDVYIVSHDGVDNNDTPSPSIVDMSATYAEQISRYATGHVLILGFCVGGLLALEIAKLLRKKGVTGIRLAFIDTTFPINIDKVPMFDEEYFRGLFFRAICLSYSDKGGNYEEHIFEKMATEKCIDYAIEQIGTSQTNEVNRWKEFLSLRYQVEMSHVCAIKQYWHRDEGEIYKNMGKVFSDFDFPLLAMVTDEIVEASKTEFMSWSAAGFSAVEIEQFSGEHNDFIKNHNKAISKRVLQYTQDYI